MQNTYKINDFIKFMKEKFNSKVYYSLDEAKKENKLLPKEDYENISFCTENTIQEKDNYICFSVKDEYNRDVLIVVQYYDNETIKFIFVPEDVENEEQFYKFLPFNEQRKNFNEDFFQILEQNNLPETAYNKKQFDTFMKKVYGVNEILDRTEIIDRMLEMYQKILAIRIEYGEIKKEDLKEELLNGKNYACYRVSGEEFFIPEEENGVLVVAEFSNDKLISVVCSYSFFKYFVLLNDLADEDEILKLLD